MSAPKHPASGAETPRVSLERFVTALDAAGCWHGDPDRKNFAFQCPLHTDAAPSGSAGHRGPDGARPGRMVFNCKACGDRNGEILTALGLSWTDLHDDAPRRPDPSSPRASGGPSRQARTGSAAPRSSRSAPPVPGDRSAMLRRGPMREKWFEFTDADDVRRFLLRRRDPISPDGRVLSRGERKKEGRDKDFRWYHAGGPNGGRVNLQRCPPGDPEACTSCRAGQTPEVVPLYRLPAVLAAVSAGARVWVTEGPGNADVLADALPEGEVATSSPDGANGPWREEFTAALEGAPVTLVADRDKQGLAYASRVAEALSAAGCAVRVVRTPIESAHADAVDHIAAGLGLEEFEDVPVNEPEGDAEGEPAPPVDMEAARAERDRRAAETTPPATREDEDEEPPRLRGPISRQLVDLAREQWEPISVAGGGETYVVPTQGPRVAQPLRGAPSFSARLSALFFDRTGRVAPSREMTDCLMLLQGMAERGPKVTLHRRVARHGEALVLDVGDETGRAVVITAAGWEVVEESPVLFARTADTGALPIPERGAEGLAELWRFVNVREEDRPLAEAELVFRYFAEVSHPLLTLTGEAGTGKTSAAETLASLIDPAPVISRPSDPKDWAVQLGQAYSPVLDNIRGLTEWQSDALCMVVTGGVTKYRQLHTDGGVVSFGGHKCVTLTSIDLGAQAADLTTRMVSIGLARFSDGNERVGEEDFKRAREAARPRLLAAVLDRVVAALAAMPRVEQEPLRLPRLGDFARVCKALDFADVDAGVMTARGAPVDRFGSYVNSLTRQAAEIADEDEVAAAVVVFMAGREEWTGTTTELHRALSEPKDGEFRREFRSRFWPETTAMFGKRLASVVGPLRAAGVEVDRSDRSAKRRTLTLRRPESACVAPTERPAPDTLPVSSPRAEAPSGPPQPCATCSTPGPWCGFGGTWEEASPCVICGTPTVVRAACGTARHGDCGGGGAPSRPVPAPDPVPPPAGPSGTTTSGSGRSTVGDAEEAANFARAVRKHYDDPKAGRVATDAEIDAALGVWHHATDGLRFVSYVGEVAIALYARLVARHANMDMPTRLAADSPALAARSGLAIFRDRLVPGHTFPATDTWITELDVNAQFLAAAGSVELGDGEPRTIKPRRGNAEALLNLPGYVTLSANVDTEHHAFGMLTAGTVLTTQTAKYLTKNRSIDLPVTDAVIWDKHGRRLRVWASVLNDAYQYLKRRGDETPARIALALVKQTYTEFIGGMLRSERYNHSHLLRPDWSDQTMTLAGANMCRALDKTAAEGHRPVGIWRDAAWFVSPDGERFAPPGLTLSRLQPGKWKTSRHVLMDDDMRTAYTGGQVVAFRDALHAAESAVDGLDGAS